jgi:uncharacterized alpha-E superfamily protein
MLSRIGNNLFWTGRYLEKAAQITGFTKVNYLSFIDTPFPDSKKEILDSVLTAAQVKDEYYALHEDTNVEQVLQFIAINDANPCSIKAYVNKLRENARGARDNISPDLWEFINTFYHSINSYHNATMQGEGFLGFSQSVEMYHYTAKGYIDNAMVRNDIWLMLSLGLHLEGALQATRMLMQTMAELNRPKPTLMTEDYEGFKLRLLLESMGCYEMYKSYYHQNVKREDVLGFIAFNMLYPRSIAYHVNAIIDISNNPHFKEHKVVDSVQYHAEKLSENLKEQTLEKLHELEVEFLEDTLSSLEGLAGMLERKYMVY